MVLLSAQGMIYGLGSLLCGSAADGVYVAAVPMFVAYVLLARRDLLARASWRHAIYFAFLTVVAAVYLMAFAGMNPAASIRWGEVAVAIYFLAALHVIVWFIDRAINRGLSFAMGLSPAGRGPGARYAVKTALRVVLLVLVAAPVVTAALMTHWLKFDDIEDVRALAELEASPAGFEAADGTRLRGWFIPAGGFLSDTTVILVPGRGMSKSSVLPQARMLKRDGSNVLVMDLRGEGASEGHDRGMGVAEGQDVLGAVKYLRQVHPRSSEQIIAYGISHGASAVIAAARADGRIKAVVADSAFPSLACELDGMVAPLLGPLRAYFRTATLAAASVQVGANLFKAGTSRDIAGISPRPVLLIHGTEDDTVPIAQANGLYAASGKPVMLWRVPHAGHGEALLCGGDSYCDVISKTIKSVRLGQPAFQWARQAGS